MVDALNGLSDGWGLNLTEKFGCDGIHKAEKNSVVEKSRLRFVTRDDINGKTMRN